MRLRGVGENKQKAELNLRRKREARGLRVIKPEKGSIVVAKISFALGLRRGP